MFCFERVDDKVLFICVKPPYALPVVLLRNKLIQQKILSDIGRHQGPRTARSGIGNEKVAVSLLESGRVK